MTELELMDEIIKFYEDKRSSLEQDLESDPESFYQKLEDIWLKLYRNYSRNSDFEPLRMSQFGFQDLKS